MRRAAAGTLFLTVSLIATLTAQGRDPADSSRYWARWRGPEANGISRLATPPLEWSEKSNIRWKIEIPGRGSASPVVWGDRLYVLTAVPAGASVPESHAPRGGLNPRGM